MVEPLPAVGCKSTRGRLPAPSLLLNNKHVLYGIIFIFKFDKIINFLIIYNAGLVIFLLRWRRVHLHVFSFNTCFDARINERKREGRRQSVLAAQLFNKRSMKGAIVGFNAENRILFKFEDYERFQEKVNNLQELSP